MADRAMPFLMLNYGAEMLFVLKVRIDAQRVEPKKAETILNSIAGHLFSNSFMDELCRPQGLYTPAAVLNVFAAIADSTVVRLSENSMKKLFQLMSMGVKYQLYTLRHPCELMEYTLNHLDEVRRILPAASHAALDNTIARIASLLSVLTAGDFAEIRKALLNYSLHSKVKASPLLEEHKQNADGSFNMPRDTYLSPIGTATEAPGTIRYISNGQCTLTEQFPHKDSGLPFPAGIARDKWNPLVATQRSTKSGANVYATSGGDALATHTRELPYTATSAAAAASTVKQPQMKGAPAPSPHQMKAYEGEMNHLSNLVSGGARSVPANEQVKLRIFATGDDDEEDETPAQAAVPSAAASGADPTAGMPVSRMTADAVKQQNKQLLGIISGLDGAKGVARPAAGGAGAGQGPSDDLLDIMDQI